MTAILESPETTDYDFSDEIVHIICKALYLRGETYGICGKKIAGATPNGNEMLCIDCDFVVECDDPCQACKGYC